MGKIFPPILKERFSLWTDVKSKYCDWNAEKAVPQEADYVVVGTGFSGTSLGFHLAQAQDNPTDKRANKKIVFLDARQLCSGASGRNGGHLAPDYVTATGGFERANYEAVFELITQYGIECWTTADSSSIGWSVLETPEDVRRVEQELARQPQISGVRLWSGEEARRRLDLKRPVCGALSFNSSPINPYRLVCWMMAHLLETQTHVDLYTHCPVSNVERTSGGKIKLHTARGDIIASKVFVATNAYTQFLGGLLHPSGDHRPQLNPITPVRGQIARFEVDHSPLPLNDDGKISLVFGDEYVSVFPYNGKFTYVVGGLRRFVDGGEENLVDDSTVNPELSTHLRSFTRQVFGITSAPVEEWTGIMGFADNPQVGQLGENLYICAGFGGHGMSRIFLCAKALVQFVHTGTFPTWFPNDYRLSSKL